MIQNMSEPLEKIREVKKKYEKTWLSISGIVAIGIGKTSGGALGIIVSVKKNTGKYKSRIGQTIEGVPIEIQTMGEIKALQNGKHPDKNSFK
jgi:hypothetical protein